jgi:hypothetical protein
MIKTKNWNFVWLLCMMLMASQVGKAFNFSDLEADNFFVTFNQPKYAPGDTAYFMGYLPANVNQTTGKKQVVHIKLLGQNNALILQERVLFVDGVGINQIIIPQALVPGVYQLNFFIETSILSKTPTVYKTSIFISDKSLSFQNMQGALLLDNSKLIIKPSSDTFKIRNKVNVVVTPGNTLKGNVSTQLSITVYNKKLFRDSIGPSSVLYMSPSYIPAMDAGKSVNSSNGADNPYYFMGRAIIKSSGAAVPDQSKITFYLNKSDLTYQITTHSGYFIFPLFRNLESEKVFYR